jgi:hypothetical protein
MDHHTAGEDRHEGPHHKGETGRQARGAGQTYGQPGPGAIATRMQTTNIAFTPRVRRDVVLHTYALCVTKTTLCESAAEPKNDGHGADLIDRGEADWRSQSQGVEGRVRKRTGHQHPMQSMRVKKRRRDTTTRR